MHVPSSSAGEKARYILTRIAQLLRDRRSTLLLVEMRASVRCLALAAVLGSVASQELRGAGDLKSSGSGSLSPFTAIDVGFRGCMPFSVTVVPGPGYSFDLAGVDVRSDAWAGKSLSAAATETPSKGCC